MVAESLYISISNYLPSLKCSDLHMHYIWRWRSEVQTKVLFFLEGTIFQQNSKFLKVIESIVIHFPCALGKKKRSQWVSTFLKLFTFKQFQNCSNSYAEKKKKKIIPRQQCSLDSALRIMCLNYIFSKRDFFFNRIVIFKLSYVLDFGWDQNTAPIRRVTESKCLQGKLKHRVIAKHTVQAKFWWKCSIWAIM